MSEQRFKLDADERKAMMQNIKFHGFGNAVALDIIEAFEFIMSERWVSDDEIEKEVHGKYDWFTEPMVIKWCAWMRSRIFKNNQE